MAFSGGFHHFPEKQVGIYLNIFVNYYDVLFSLFSSLFFFDHLDYCNEMVFSIQLEQYFLFGGIHFNGRISI